MDGLSGIAVVSGCEDSWYLACWGFFVNRVFLYQTVASCCRQPQSQSPRLQHCVDLPFVDCGGGGGDLAVWVAVSVELHLLAAAANPEMREKRGKENGRRSKRLQRRLYLLPV